MARNPIIYNDGGIHRFADYVSQVPDFLKAEEDVVVFLQVLSDYINNAYRNIDTVEKFEFRFIAVDSNLTLIQNRVQQFINLLKRSESRNERILYLSKPEGNPRIPSRPLYIEYIDYNGDLDNLSPGNVTAPLSALETGDKFFINFTKDGQEENTGVYVLDKEYNTLTIDPNGTSQDPFNNTPNEPFRTLVGLAPRMVEFTASDISKLHVRKSGVDGNLVYYEVFFDVKITDIESVSSIYTQEVDIDGDGIRENILIDYYNMIDSLPSIYDEDFEINFADNCTDFEWRLGVNNGLFYARDLTQYERNVTNVNRDGENKYVDPLFSPNTTVLSIIEIKTISTNRVQIKVNGDHKLSVGDKITIKNAGSFDSNGNEVISIVGTNTFVVNNSTVGTENGGAVIVRNLFYSKVVDDPTNFKLKLPYVGFIGDTDFENGDKVARVIYEFQDILSTFDAATEVDLVTSALIPSSPTNLSVGDTVTLRATGSGSSVPVGLTEGEIYTISELNTVELNGVNRTGIRFTDQVITAIGVGEVSIVKMNRYFNTDDIDLIEDLIKVNNYVQLSVGDVVRFKGETDTMTLPTPLQEGTNYIVEDVQLDGDGNPTLIKLEGVDLTAIGTSGVNFDIYKIIPDLNNVASIEINQILNPLSNGKITFASYRGDLISIGEIIRIASIGGKNGIATATINTTAEKWTSRFTKLVHYANELVEYNGLRYRTLKTHSSEADINTTPLESSNYALDMSDIIERDKIIDLNPYMMGMYHVQSLGFNGSIDYGIGYSNLANDLYIKKEEDLELKYGHDQREFIFDPRLAPADKLVRNGFMEIINSDEDHDAYDGDVSDSIKVQTNTSKLLYGVKELVFNIANITYSDGIATVVTSENHPFRTGITVNIDGITETEFNGLFEITVNSDSEFTYEVTSTTAFPTGATKTVTYNQDVIIPISSITRSSTTATVVTGIEHGYTDGTEVVIAGADQVGYNGTVSVTVTGDKEFTYQVSGTEVTPATTSTEITTTYTPKVGDFINVVAQYSANENGTYIVRDLNWDRYDNSVIGDPVVLFTRQNLFDVSESNPSLAVEPKKLIRSLTYLGARLVRVQLHESHLYSVGSIVTISGAVQPEYNGRFPVVSVSNATTFTYFIEAGVSPVSPATGELYSQVDMWYKFTLSDIQWQRKSNYNNTYYGLTLSEIDGNGSLITVTTHDIHSFNRGDQVTITNTTAFNGTFTINDVIDETKITILGSTVGNETVGRVYRGYSIASNQNKDNVSLLKGEYSFTLDSGLVLHFVENDIVTLSDQFVPYENGVYRVVKGGAWNRLDKRLVMKVRTATVDAYEDVNYSGLYEDESPYIYRTYRDDQVNTYIENNFAGDNQVYKVESLFASNFSFIYEKVDNIDTAGPFQKQYDAKFDKNSVVSRRNMSSDFKGVTDMDYPLVEKFERLTYIKDPNVIDMELIEYLARFMGYDITALSEDIEESTIYRTEEERNMALRRTIQTLPQYYALKSTKAGLEMMLLAFGIVGELVTIWTRQENPYGSLNDNDTYDDMVPDYELRGLQYAEMENGRISSFVPTPHFSIRVEIEGNFDNQILPSDERRVTSQITQFKPINTVFDGIYRFITAKLSASVTAGNSRHLGKMKSTVGFTELNFDDEITNDCI